MKTPVTNYKIKLRILIDGHIFNRYWWVAYNNDFKKRQKNTRGDFKLKTIENFAFLMTAIKFMKRQKKYSGWLQIENILNFSWASEREPAPSHI